MNLAEFQSRITSVLDAQRVVATDPIAYAAHYTRAATPSLLLQGAASNLIRQYDGDYMNDPEEGRYLVDVMILAAKNSTHQHASAFVERFTKLRTSRLLYTAYQKCTFISCWTTTFIKPGKEDASDSLNHWRFYGDDGKGACIIVPLANLLPIFPRQLFRVNYGIEARGGGAGAANRPIRQIKDALQSRLNSLRRSFGNAMEDLEQVIQAMHPLLFLYKSGEYTAESEVRSIVHKDGYAAGQGVIFDLRTPSRAYVESAPGVISNGSIIYFGPKSDQTFAIEAMGHAANLPVEVKVFLSNMPYR